MARTQEEIQTELQALVDAQPELAALEQNPSQVTWWKAIKNIWITFVRNLEVTIDIFRTQVTEQINENGIGSLQSYSYKALQFQYGDRVGISNDRYRYDVIDADKRIIDQAASKDNQNASGIEIKVLKEGNVPLNADEKLAFTDYMTDVKIAGMPITVVSLPATNVDISLDVQVNPQLIEVSNGENENGVEVIKVAVQNYFIGLQLSTVFRIIDFVDEIQKVSGVKDVYVRAVTAESYGAIKTSLDSQSGHYALRDFTASYTEDIIVPG